MEEVDRLNVRGRAALNIGQMPYGGSSLNSQFFCIGHRAFLNFSFKLYFELSFFLQVDLRFQPIEIPFLGLTFNAEVIS